MERKKLIGLCSGFTALGILVGYGISRPADDLGRRINYAFTDAADNFLPRNKAFDIETMYTKNTQGDLETYITINNITRPVLYSNGHVLLCFAEEYPIKQSSETPGPLTLENKLTGKQLEYYTQNAREQQRRALK